MVSHHDGPRRLYVLAHSNTAPRLRQPIKDPARLQGPTW